MRLSEVSTPIRFDLNYVDDAIRDGARSMDAAIIQGQQTMIGEIFDSIVTFLSNMADDLEEEEGDLQRKYELENPVSTPIRFDLNCHI